MIRLTKQYHPHPFLDIVGGVFFLYGLCVFGVVGGGGYILRVFVSKHIR